MCRQRFQIPRPSARAALCLGVVVAAILVASVTGFAAQPPDSSETSGAPLRLESLLEEARGHNAALQGAHERWQAARHRIAQAGALPNPSAGTMIMGGMLETRLGPQEQVFELEQELPFPGKLWQKRQMARAEADGAEAAYRAVERDVIRDVAAAYYALYATDASIRVVEELLGRLRGLEEIAQARYASQGGSQRDVAKAQAEVSMTLERLFVLRQQRQTLAARLNALLSRHEHEPIGALAEPPQAQLAYTLDELLLIAERGRPELREAASMVQRDRHATNLARLENAPDVTVGFQYIGIGSGDTTDPDDGRDAWMIPVKVTLPIWQNRILPAIQEAGRNLRASEAGLRDARNTTQYEVRDAYYRYTSARTIVALYENALLPEAELAFHSDQAGYEAGRQDALNLLDSERVHLNAQVAYQQALADARTRFVELERAVGRSLITREGDSHE